MYSKKKSLQPVRKKPLDWKSVIFAVFCIVMVIMFIIQAVT
jgi:hypothetical protein